MDFDVWVGGKCYSMNPIVRMRRKVEETLNRAIDERQFEVNLDLVRYDLIEKFDEEMLVQRVVERFREDEDDE